METTKNRLVHLGIITIFCSLYFLVATISMINSVAFFDLAHQGAMNWSLAIGFELGAAASLAAIIILDKTNRFMVWTLFLLLTAFQMMANSYHAFINLDAYMGWIELFGLEEMEPLAQKRILAIVSGAVLPIVALGFIKSLVDYIRPEKEEVKTKVNTLDNLFDPKPIIPEQKKSFIKAVTKDDIVKSPIGSDVHTGDTVYEEDRPELKAIRESQISNIKSKTPLIEETEEVPPIAEGSIAKDNPHPGYAPESQSEAIKQDLGNVVDVRVEDNTTYVTTRPKTDEDI